jgi:hypothetical protein
MATYDVTGIKDFVVSGDGKEATFTLVTQQKGSLTCAMPVEILDVLKRPTQSKIVKTEKGTVIQGTLHRPEKWLLWAETSKHKIVGLVFDPQTDREAGFALSAKSAKDLAAGLVNSADTVANAKPAKPN